MHTNRGILGLGGPPRTPSPAAHRPLSPLLALVVLLAALVPPASPQAAHAAQGDQGLQGGWAIDDGGNTDFPRSVRRQAPLMRDAGAGWVRINFRLGACFSDWTTPGCQGRTALDKYDAVVNAALANNLRVLGLISHESWHGDQIDWTANSAEVAGGSGDNAYVQGFAGGAAETLAAYFAGRVGAWEVWNEPNAWTELDGAGNPTGGTYLWPSNFAWLLARSHAAIKAAQPGATVVSGGVLGHDIGGYATTRYVRGVPTRVTLRGERRGARPPVRLPDSTLSTDACREALPSGNAYLCDTYLMGITRAGWRGGAYPLDAVGQHLYVDQGGATSGGKLAAYFQDLRNAYAQFEGAGTAKRTHVTEIGWTTAAVPPDIQARNVATTYEAARGTSYVARAYWFAVQDVPEADLYYGLTDGDGGRKPSFDAYARAAGGGRSTPADLYVGFADAPARIYAGDGIDYAVVVTNAGPSPATGSRLVVTMPAGLPAQSRSASQGACSGTFTVTCELGTLAAGAAATVRVGAVPGTTGTLTAIARATAADPDPTPGNNVASATTTVDPLPPVSCSPRPRVGVQADPTGDGRLRVIVSAGGAGNWLRALRFERATNALIDAAGMSGSAGDATVALPSGTGATQFFVRRVAAGPSTVPLVVVDRCGEWRTFVGGGHGSF